MMLISGAVSGVYDKQKEGGTEKNIEQNRKLIPITDFKITDLPQCYQHDEMLQLVKSLADITVKVEVTGVSGKRKEFWTEEKQQRTFGMIDPIISSDFLIASGKVHDVFIRTERDGPNPCQCEKCEKDSVKEWGEIRILTTAQLLYDDDDAKHFFATFLFDDDEHSSDIRKVQGFYIMARSIEKDLCMFTCRTCDLALIEKLEKMLDKFEESWKKAYAKYARSVKWDDEKLVIIAYYPYGQKKHISLGKKEKMVGGRIKISYDAPPYPGSSGAYLLIPDFDVKKDTFAIYK